MKAHPIVHVEIPATDLRGASTFYSQVFGWQIDQSMEDYPMFVAEGGPGGGFVELNEQTTSGPVPYAVGKLLIYIGTDDIEATLATVESHGGKTLLPKSEIPNIGWWAVFSDPSGNSIALFTPNQAGAQGSAASES